MGLLTVAALLPKEWQVSLRDLNTGRRDLESRDFDLVMMSAMYTQRESCLFEIAEFQKRGVRVVVGGPDATENQTIYSRANHLLLGEAELTLPLFINDLDSPKRVYDQRNRRAELSQSPRPRYDLINIADYLSPTLQVSRGCPFQCEFCDAIELDGRIPRFKKPTQVVDELKNIHARGYRGRIKIVDDNLIGNKKAAFSVLEAIESFQRERDFPFTFFSQLTINVSDDHGLLSLLRRCNFTEVSIGFESRDSEILAGMKKWQNTKRSLVDSIHKIYSYGIFVSGGFILGADGEKPDVARDILDAVNVAPLPNFTVSLLQALPATQLHKRLIVEKRLLWDIGETISVGPKCVFGLNFITTRPREEILEDYCGILKNCYKPFPYFSGVRRLLVLLDRKCHPLSIEKVSVSKRSSLGLRLLKLGRLLVQIGKYPPPLIPFAFSLMSIAVSEKKKLPLFFNLAIQYADRRRDVALTIGETKKLIRLLYSDGMKKGEGISSKKSATTIAPQALLAPSIS